MNTLNNLLLVLLLPVAGAADAAPPALRVLKAAQSGQTLLRNGDFEQQAGERLANWQAAPKGFRLAPGEGRSRSQALACDNPTGEGWQGASQTLALNRTNIAPLLVRGWSRAENVSGSADSGYSLYLDLVYADGTPLWGQTANFRCGTHDWEQRQFTILPDKPVKTLTLHCLFRGHAGRVWFDDVAVEELKGDGATALYQGVPVVLPDYPPGQTNRRETPRPRSRGRRLATRDGLELDWFEHTVASLQVDGRELSAQVPSGFLARDVAANSDFYELRPESPGRPAPASGPVHFAGTCPELGLKIEAQFAAPANHLQVQGRLVDTTRQDRAITLVFALPVAATDWRWGEDVRRSRRIEGNGEYTQAVGVRCGATGTMSLYPLAPVYHDRQGLALALDMGQPAQYRLGYHAGFRQLFIAYDFGLVQDTEHFPGGADFRFVLYRFDPQWGFRGAFQKLMEIFPDYFVVRARDQGLWMPFTDVSKVQGWQDFGFKFHEGNNNVPFDDANGILSFRYTEPMTWWMPMPKEVPRTPGEALRIRDDLARGANARQRQMAWAAQSAGMWDDIGQPSLLFRNEPWCNGAVWSLNPNPRLPGAATPPGQAPANDAPATNLNAATVHWNEALKEKLYGPAAKGRLDGEYLDSLEGYVTADLNFRRDHFRYTTVPLTFAADTKKPALFKGLAVFEFTKWICDEVHRLDKLTFANGVPYRFTFLCPWLDVLGTETDWLRNGRYRPASDSQMCLWRTLSGGKPYLLLMNTDYDAFDSPWVEKYFQRSLFYGMFPGMFSHNASENPYWQNPKWYNRDRALFKKYLPLIKQIAEAGWQPVTGARCDNDHLFVERFGPTRAGRLYLTLFNDTDQDQRGLLTVDRAALGWHGPLAPRELLSGQALRPAGAGWTVMLSAQQAAVVAPGGE